VGRDNFPIHLFTDLLPGWFARDVQFRPEIIRMSLAKNVSNVAGRTKLFYFDYQNFRYCRIFP
jgi:hypothetical protein